MHASEPRTIKGRPRYDAVIVGSGFGGSVMAYRLAAAQFKVCVLERGQSYAPGSFPRSPHAMKRNFWDPSEGLYGMFNLWSFRHLGAVVASGLGGGSLIYANVLIRKDRNWFVQSDNDPAGEYWPVTYNDLEQHYIAAEQMLGAAHYPFDVTPYSETPKTTEFRAAAERLGLEWSLPHLAVSFAPGPNATPVPGEPIHEGDAPNLHGRTRFTCRLIGECDIGCNYGSKNSLDFNYLSRAKDAGAEIKCLSEARRFRRAADGIYEIDYLTHSLPHEATTSERGARAYETVTARLLILAAGTLGTTYLLLRNRAAFPAISDRLGSRFSGNGDLLTFAVGATRMIDGRRMPRLLDAARGPVITSTVRVADALDGGGHRGRGYYIQDAGYPDFANWMLQAINVPGALGAWFHVGRKLFWKWLSGQPETDIGAEASEMFGETRLSTSLLPLLGMGRDIPDGRMRLRDGKLDVVWQLRNSRPYFRRLRRTMRALAHELGASSWDNPIWHLSRVITVHPLGGCPMGRDAGEGVVDGWGQVFNYDGLYVSDGSVMPGPVGPNPSLTIAALAERFAARIIETRRPMA